MALSGTSTAIGKLVKHSLESLPRRIFLDTCTAQTLNEGEPIDASDRVHRVTDGAI